MEWKTVAMGILVVSLCFFAIPVRINDDKDTEDVRLFEQYVARYNKSYKQNLVEYSERFEHFQKSLRDIEKLNSLRSSQESAYYGLTEFSDMSETEFLAQALQPELWINSKKHTTVEGAVYHAHEHRHRHSGRNHNLVKRAVTGIPLKIDWRDKGVVTPVRAQGTCGACWAFSTIEVIESMFAIKNGSLQSLSIQEMIDCAGNSNFGCDGGDICSLLMWLMTTKTKVLPEANYPLTWTTDKCQLKKDSQSQGIRVADYTCDNFVGAENELLATIATHGPVAAAVNALSWQHYLGGVIQYHCDGSFSNLNHAVQIIGYDKSAAIPHYIIKNSWGPKFGDKGYIYVAIDDNVCGVANQVSSVDVI